MESLAPFFKSINFEDIPVKMAGTDQGARYRAHWSTNENADDIANDVSGITSRREERQKDYVDIARDYYDLTTSNLVVGWGEIFHFSPRILPRETIESSLHRHEHFLALMTGMRPGMKVLDAGCGVGGPATEMARFAGVNVTGVSINKVHVKYATELAEWEGVPHLCEFVEGDFMNLPFPDNTFDVVYSTEATVYAPNLAKCYAELARVLKPGGVFGTYEWLMTRSFSAQNPRHVELRQRLERGDGITNIPSVPEALDAVKAAGLELQHDEDMALRSDGPWYFYLDGETGKAQSWKDWWLIWWLRPAFFRAMCVVAWVDENVIRRAPKGTCEGLHTQGMSVYGMRDAAKEGVWTPMYMMVGKKPLEGWKPTVSPRYSIDDKQVEGKEGKEK